MNITEYINKFSFEEEKDRLLTLGLIDDDIDITVDDYLSSLGIKKVIAEYDKTNGCLNVVKVEVGTSYLQIIHQESGSYPIFIVEKDREFGKKAFEFILNNKRIYVETDLGDFVTTDSLDIKLDVRSNLSCYEFRSKLDSFYSIKCKTWNIYLNSCFGNSNSTRLALVSVLWDCIHIKAGEYGFYYTLGDSHIPSAVRKIQEVVAALVAVHQKNNQLYRLYIENCKNNKSVLMYTKLYNETLYNKTAIQIKIVN